MGDFFLFIFVLWFISVTSPIWIILGSLYGIFIAVIKFFSYVMQSFTYISYDAAEGLVALFVASPLMAIWDGLKASIEPVSYFWDFALVETSFPQSGQSLTFAMIFSPF